MLRVKTNILMIAALCTLAVMGTASLAVQYINSRVTAIDFFADIGPGWNLGNSLDSYSDNFHSRELADYETMWGNPNINSALFEEVHAAGFRSVRIPITWYMHVDDNFNINPKWMKHIKATVDMALNAGLYVIINSHHDHWYNPYPGSILQAEEKLTALWQQIGEAFSDYDQRLIFEGMNEPRLIGYAEEWKGGTPEARAAVNRLNQSFVNTVRSAPGENSKRYLLVPTYGAAAMGIAIEEFKVPQDDRLAISVHLYSPLDFALTADGTSNWNIDNPKDTEEFKTAMGNLNAVFIQNGVPVVLTEYGSLDRGNEEVRAAWAEFIIQTASDAGIPCIWWDNGTIGVQNPSGTFSLLNRYNNTWYYPGIVDAITKSEE